MIRAEATGLAALGPEWDPVFAAGAGVQSRRAWFEATAEAALPAGLRPLVLAVRDGGTPLALLPLKTGAGGVSSLTSPYSVLFQPLVRAADAPAAGAALGRALRRGPPVRLEALDADWPGLAGFVAGLRRGGMAALPFDHFGNWFERVEGRDWAGYLAARPGALRETIRRRERAAARDPLVRFEVVRGEDGLAAALAAYEAIYARSWKEPEPFPAFNETVLPRLARAGVLRMGVMWRGTVPVAAQYWTVQDGTATVLKLAYDDGWKALSPGTVLSAHMIRLLLAEGVRELDYGRGDDAYKQGWTGKRRQRIGLVLVNPLRPAGLAALLRHRAGQLARRLRG